VGPGRKKMKMVIQRSYRMALLCGCIVLLSDIAALGHGTLVYPMSRVYRVYESNPENPAFELARDAIAIDGTGSYY